MICPAIFGWAYFSLAGGIMDFVTNRLFYGIVTIGTIIITAFIVSGFVFVAKCLIHLFEDALDEMREKGN